MEEPAPYRTDHVRALSIAPEDLIAQAQARQVGLSYESREQWLQRLPERLRDPSDLVLGRQDERGGDRLCPRHLDRWVGKRPGRRRPSPAQSRRPAPR